MRVGLIGTGGMGEPIARRLLEAGHELRVFNRTSSRTAALVAAGAQPARSPAEAASGREVVLTVLTDAEAVRAVVAGPGGAVAGLRPDAVLVDVSTTGPAFARELRDLVPAGVGVLDAPVLGSRAEAAAGALRLLVGGEGRHLARCGEVLEALGTVWHVGPAGAGAAAKLVANFALLATLTALGDAVKLGAALDLDLDTTAAVLGSTPLAEQATKRRAALEGSPGPTRFALALAAKDAELVCAAARAAQVEVATAAVVRDRLEAALSAGRGAHDYTAMLAPG